MPLVEQEFFVGDVVETIGETALLPLGIQAEILKVDQNSYVEENGGDGRGYHITYEAHDGEIWTLDYASTYFKLIKRDDYAFQDV